MDFDTTMDPEPHLHRDLRSSSIPKQRRRKELTKYYSYRAVHPSWVGQTYYTLQLVSSTVHTAQVQPRPRHKPPKIHITHVTEKEEPILLETLRKDSGWYSFRTWWMTSETHLAIAQAKAADINSYPIVLPESSSDPSPTDSPSLSRIPIPPPTPYPSTMPTNLHLKLRPKTWTKADNYTTAPCFWWGPDRRHHRGKRAFREKHLQKWNEKELGRGTRQRWRQLDHERNECREIYVDGRWCDPIWEEWKEEASVWWNWDVENWLGTGWWDDDGMVADEEWGWADKWTEKVDEGAVIHKVLDWRELRCDYEGMVEMEMMEEDEKDEDAISVGSEVVLEWTGDEDADADFDKMSDLAEVLVDGEWDVVSDSSSLFGDVT